MGTYLVVFLKKRKLRIVIDETVVGGEASYILIAHPNIFILLKTPLKLRCRGRIYTQTGYYSNAEEKKYGKDMLHLGECPWQLRP